MPRSTKVFALAGIAGAPAWLVPDACLTLRSPIFYGLAIVSFGALVIGLALWQLDGK